MLAALKNALAWFVETTTEWLATYLAATPSTATQAVLPFTDSPVENAMDQVARRTASVVLVAAAIVVAYIPWVSPLLSGPVADFLHRLAALLM